MKKHTVYKALSLFLPIQIMGVYFIQRQLKVSQNGLYNSFYVFLVGILRKTNAIFPFSVGDIFYTFIFLLSLYYLISIFRKKSWFFVLKITSLLSVLYFCFYLFWGLNYNRTPLYETLNLNFNNSKALLLNKLCTQLIYKANILQLQLAKSDTLKVTAPYDKKSILIKSAASYKNLAKVFPFLRYKNPNIKFSLYSKPLSYMGYSGYYNPFSAEAQVNYEVPQTQLPFTSCHEIAHQIGFAPEQEANFIGYLACINSDDAFVQYSGYLVALSYALNNLKYIDNKAYNKILYSINKGIFKNYRENNKFWQAHKNPTTPLFESVYDKFLKANKQASGIKSYSGIVKLLLAYHKDHPLKKT
ncbi:MAG: DUF3810 domain-containing protein [Flavobacteriaceae bacterium]